MSTLGFYPQGTLIFVLHRFAYHAQKSPPRLNSSGRLPPTFHPLKPILPGAGRQFEGVACAAARQVYAQDIQAAMQAIDNPGLARAQVHWAER